ncbi:MAG: GAF domain-containing protein [Chloroflexi bacterium]|nr:GAF domain-containing protein [Chloroflexota bacterium]
MGETTQVTSDSVDIVNLLSDVARDSNNLVKGDGTSIFLKDEESEKYFLIESTALTRALGNFHIDVSRLAERFDKGDVKNIGLTAFAILSQIPLLVNDPIHDDRIATYGHTDAENAPPTELSETHFEIAGDELGAFMAIPLRSEGGRGQVFGVIRVVRSKKKEPFCDDDMVRLTQYLDSMSTAMENAFSWATLIDVGRVAFDLQELCSQVTRKLGRVIGGVGCSIFLLDEEKSSHETDVYSCAATTGLVGRHNHPISHPREAFYSITRTAPSRQASTSLTEWVIRNKQNLLIDGIAHPLTGIPALNRAPGPGKYSEVHLGRKIGGPVLLAPLLSRDLESVVGVLRISKAEGSTPFNGVQKKLFLSFAPQLSKAINTARYMAILERLSTSTGLTESELFDMVVNQVPKLVGAKGCSLFIVRGKELGLAATSGWLKEKYGGDLSKAPPYSISEGYTGWVAESKKPLRFNDKSELLAERYDDDRPSWSGRTNDCEVGKEHQTCDRFLAVPVFSLESSGKPLRQKEVVGVVRVPKMKWEDPFTTLDEKLMVAFAARLSPAIDRTRLQQTARERRRSEIERTFSPFLLKECSKLSSVGYKGLTARFFSDAETTSQDMGLLVLSSIRGMWGANSSLRTSTDPPFGDFKIFEDYLLKRGMPDYRDHFIHSYQVFLAGSYVLDRLCQYPQGLNLLAEAFSTEAEPGDKAKQDFETAWLVTSTFHDIAYPIQLLRESLDNLIRRLIKTSESIVDSINIERVLFDRGHSYLDCVDRITEFYKNMAGQANADNWIPNPRFRLELLHLLREKRDHGVLGALILADRYFSNLNRTMLASCLAIASHKDMLSHIGEIRFGIFPVSFMLAYCDLIQEWGRDSEDTHTGKPVGAKLEKIIVDDIPPRVAVLEKSHTSGRIYVNAFIILDGNASRMKSNEVEAVFKHLRSSNPVFCVSLNGEVVGHSLV